MSLTGKDPDAGRAWGQEEKGTTEDEVAGWHPRLDGREFGRTLGGGEGRGAWRAAVPGVVESQGVTQHSATEQQHGRLRVTEPFCCS